jgi:indole-3-glycerol phosphate synthase
MILDDIAEKTRERVARAKDERPEREVRDEAERLAAGKPEDMLPFEKAIRADGMSFICEVKRSSPSKGMIAEDFPYLEIAKDYEDAGASAMSVLTEPYWFGGSNDILREITGAAGIPVLRKDFTVDRYMIYKAKTLGASAVLLICAILSESELQEYSETAAALGLDALVEAHTEEEAKMAVRCGARIIGVNNRDLKTFTVDTGRSAALRELIPREIAFVSESGIKEPEQVRELEERGVDAVLIGETLMRAKDKKKMLCELAGRKWT